MSDAKVAKSEPNVAKASKRAKRAESPERRQLVTTMARSLWTVYVTSEEQKLDAAQKKASWKEHRKSYMHMAKGLMRRLESKGIVMTQGEKPKPRAGTPAA